MTRAALFTREDFLRCAERLIAEQGPEAATTAAILKGVGAPAGSFYHRFASRDLLLGELWLGLAEGYQKEFLACLRGQGVLAAALFTPRWVRQHPVEAQVLLIYRREDFASRHWPADFVRRAEELACELRSGLREFSQGLGGLSPEEDFQRVRFALIEVPLAAVRRHLKENIPVPASIDDWVAACCSALISAANRRQEDSDG